MICEQGLLLLLWGGGGPKLECYGTANKHQLLCGMSVVTISALATFFWGEEKLIKKGGGECVREQLAAKFCV